MSGTAFLPDGVEVLISPFLPRHEVRVGPDGKVYAGSREAIERTVAEANRWIYLRTHPPSAMNRETGELIDLPEPPEERCRRCGDWHG